MPDALYFEDFQLGEVVEYGRVDVSVDEIIAFAREFDPQLFHTDEEAARAATGGLIASGWHTSAMLLRMNCEAFLTRAAILEEPASKRSGGSSRSGRAIGCTCAARRSPVDHAKARPPRARSSFSTKSSIRMAWSP
jgi:hypothetical protein